MPKRPGLAIVVLEKLKKGKKGGDSPGPSVGMESASADFLSAVKSDDPKKVASAFMNMQHIARGQ